jgi:5-methylcytosine-specific restriction endonuclease McrBC GTP-binding regulatory subunit McrB
MKYKVGDRVKFSYGIGTVAKIEEYAYIPQEEGTYVVPFSQLTKAEEAVIGYKVVKEVDGEYYSCVAGGERSLQYRLYKKTKASPPIYAFDTLENAKSFVYAPVASGSEYKILKCVLYKSDDGGVLLDPPVGTVLCDWVFPFEVID